jgi:uncharacterized protein YjdB
MVAKKSLALYVVLAACISAFFTAGCGSSSSIPQLGIVASSSSLSVGSTMSLKAMVTRGTGTPLDVTAQTTWSSSNAQTASISASGVVTGIAAGSALITATSGGLTATTPLTVTAATVTGLALSPQGASIPLGLTQQFTATAIYGNKTTPDVSSSVT